MIHSQSEVSPTSEQSNSGSEMATTPCRLERQTDKHGTVCVWYVGGVMCVVCDLCVWYWGGVMCVVCESVMCVCVGCERDVCVRGV